MAIGFDAVSKATITSNSVLSWSHTIGGAKSRKLIVGVHWEQGGNSPRTVSSITFNGVNLTQIPGAHVELISSGGTGAGSDQWYIDEKDLPTTGTYTITVTVNASTKELHGGGISLLEAAAGDPEAVATNSNESSTTISTNITTITTAGGLVDAVTNGTDGTFTADVGQTELYDQQVGTSTSAGSVTGSGVPGVRTMGWTHASGALRMTHSVSMIAAAAPIYRRRREGY